MVRAKTPVTLRKKRLNKSRPADKKDIEIINRNSKRLNRQAIDTLKHQQLP